MTGHAGALFGAGGRRRGMTGHAGALRSAFGRAGRVTGGAGTLFGARGGCRGMTRAFRGALGRRAGRAIRSMCRRRTTRSAALGRRGGATLGSGLASPFRGRRCLTLRLTLLMRPSRRTVLGAARACRAVLGATASLGTLGAWCRSLGTWSGTAGTARSRLATMRARPAGAARRTAGPATLETVGRLRPTGRHGRQDQGRDKGPGEKDVLKSGHGLARHQEGDRATARLRLLEEQVSRRGLEPSVRRTPMTP